MRTIIKKGGIMNEIYNEQTIERKFNEYKCKIGLEYECGASEEHCEEIKREFEELDILSVQISSDTSVCVGNEYGYDDWLNNLEIKVKLDNFKSIKPVLNILHKFGLQNNTCGNHFHISFNNPAITESIANKITFENIQRDFIEYVSKKEKLKKRLDTFYCSMKNFTTEILVNQMYAFYRDCVRRSPINLNSLRKFGTIEVRILPDYETSEEHYNDLLYMLAFVFKLVNKSVSLNSRLNVMKEMGKTSETNESQNTTNEAKSPMENIYIEDDIRYSRVNEEMKYEYEIDERINPLDYSYKQMLCFDMEALRCMRI